MTIKTCTVEPNIVDSHSELVYCDPSGAQYFGLPPGIIENFFKTEEIILFLEMTFGICAFRKRQPLSGEITSVMCKRLTLNKE